MREEKEVKHKHEFMIEQDWHRTEGGKEKEKKRKREERGSAPRKELGEILENERKKKSRNKARRAGAHLAKILSRP